MTFPTPQQKPEDIFDLVDENDAVIGRERRSVIHREGLRHRAVHLLLYNGKGEVFLQRRSPAKDMNPDCWDSSCSGHVDSGETYDVAAVRELVEELGVVMTLATLLPIEKIEANPGTANEFVQVYRGRHDGPFVLCPEEITDGRFFPPAEIDARIEAAPREFSPAFRHIWGRVRDRFPSAQA
ncbi:isopentenyl-diphosphate delta-isomerase, type 1 [Verrucomicrobium sp. GAS474]|uniref:NUDIX hydrolase n=1 Tax=Verrucomicrobium sp. GAS474 TaxID=1882831 RepID=UPI00087BE072|nr:NUDIX domain-containing protein [Verrucomicrobium sp. GAS474]SDT89246.1 isopentenyl-diphosphate delta-isomerase, type 1 [Verrucomicrobium sp. GAS474]